MLIHAAGTNSLAAMSRMRDLRARVPDAMWTMAIALAALAALPPVSGFFSKESVLRAAERAADGHQAAVPSAVGWTVLVAALATAPLTAAYATRLFLLAFRGSGSARPSERRVPVVMNVVLWVLAIPTLALGVTVGRLPKWFDGTALTPTLATSVLGAGLALIGVLVTYAAWRVAATRSVPITTVATHPEALPAAENPDGATAAPPADEASAAEPAAAEPAGDEAAAETAKEAAVVAAAENEAKEPAAVEAAAIAAHPVVYGDIADAEDLADPGRLLLGPLHRHAAHGFHLDALYSALFVRPVLAAAGLVRFLDREVIEGYVGAAGGLPRTLGALVRRAQTGNVQTYLSVLLAGSVVLAALAVLVAAGV